MSYVLAEMERAGTSEMFGERGKCLIKGMTDTKEQMCEMTEDNSLKGKKKQLGFHEYPSLPVAKVIRIGAETVL